VQKGLLELHGPSRSRLASRGILSSKFVRILIPSRVVVHGIIQYERTQGDDFLEFTVSGNETLVAHYTPENKQ